MFEGGTMGLREAIVRYGGAASIFVASVIGGGKVAGQLKTFDPGYWKQEVIEEKDKRLEILDRIGGLGRGGVYSVDDLAMLHDGTIYATMLFNYMDTDEGDLPAYDNPISPGDMIMGNLNVKYGGRFDTRQLLTDLRKVYEAGKPLRLDETDLDERIAATIGEVRATFSDPALCQEDLREAEYSTQSRKWLTGGSGGFLIGLLTWAGLNYLCNRKRPETS